MMAVPGFDSEPSAQFVAAHRDVSRTHAGLGTEFCKFLHRTLVQGQDTEYAEIFAESFKIPVFSEIKLGRAPGFFHSLLTEQLEGSGFHQCAAGFKKQKSALFPGRSGACGSLQFRQGSRYGDGIPFLFNAETEASSPVVNGDCGIVFGLPPCFHQQFLAFSSAADYVYTADAGVARRIFQLFEQPAYVSHRGQLGQYPRSAFQKWLEQGAQIGRTIPEPENFASAC